MTTRLGVAERAVGVIAKNLGVIVVAPDGVAAYRRAFHNDIEFRIARKRDEGMFTISGIDLERADAHRLVDLLTAKVEKCRNIINGHAVIDILASNEFTLPDGWYEDEKLLQHIERAALALMESVDAARKGGGPVL